MRVQKGQGIVEFAMVLPFLVLIVIGLIYIGLLFSDYIALNNIARTAARDAALISETDYDAEGSDPYKVIRQKYVAEAQNGNSSAPEKYFLPNSLYIWNPSNHSHFDIQNATDSNNDTMVVVTLKAPINEESSGLYRVFVAVIGSALDELTITYEMRSETKFSSN